MMDTTLTELRPADDLALWLIDPARSTFEFRLEQFLGLTTLDGRLDPVGGMFLFEYDGTPHFQLTLDAATIATGSSTWDALLRSPAFFNVDTYPLVRFTTIALEETANGRLRLNGWLELAGQCAGLTFDADLRRNGDLIKIAGSVLLAEQATGMTSGGCGTAANPVALDFRATLEAV
jgi:polyisoprenoid-binding protein YceI